MLWSHGGVQSEWLPEYEMKEPRFRITGYPRLSGSRRAGMAPEPPGSRAHPSKVRPIGGGPWSRSGANHAPPGLSAGDEVAVMNLRQPVQGVGICVHVWFLGDGCSRRPGGGKLCTKRARVRHPRTWALRRIPPAGVPHCQVWSELESEVAGSLNTGRRQVGLHAIRRRWEDAGRGSTRQHGRVHRAG